MGESIPLKSEGEATKKIKIVPASSKADEPLSKDFVFSVNGFVYQVYDTRSRGRKFVKLLGIAKEVK